MNWIFPVNHDKPRVAHPSKKRKRRFNMLQMPAHVYPALTESSNIVAVNRNHRAVDVFARLTGQPGN